MGNFRKQSGQLNHMTKHPFETVQAARVLHEQGWGYTKIARALGTVKPTVSQWVNYYQRLKS